VEKSSAKLKEKFYWLGHYNDVRVNCSSHEDRSITFLQPVKVTHPLEIEAIDILGLIPANENGNCYILVEEDYFPNGWRPGQFPIRRLRLLFRNFWRGCFSISHCQTGCIQIRGGSLKVN